MSPVQSSAQVQTLPVSRLWVRMSFLNCWQRFEASLHSDYYTFSSFCNPCLSSCERNEPTWAGSNPFGRARRLSARCEISLCDWLTLTWSGTKHTSDSTVSKAALHKLRQADWWCGGFELTLLGSRLTDGRIQVYFHVPTPQSLDSDRSRSQWLFQLLAGCL